MLKFNDPNPLNVHQLRRVEHLPPHFSQINFTAQTSDKEVTDWIWENLAGRFYYGDIYIHNGTGFEMVKCVAFEDHGESSYFALMLDTINKYNQSIF